MSTAVRGGTAGLTATAAMSAFMIAAERLGAMRGQPPQMVVERLTPELEGNTAKAAALIGHGAYGAMAGVAFALLGGDRLRAQEWGALYGALIWVGGYEGWLPALGVLPPAHRDQPARAAVMLTAHLIYGSVLGRLLRRR